MTLRQKYLVIQEEIYTMQNVQEKNAETYAFEMAPEVREKIDQADGRKRLIPEKKVKDLKYIDVTKRPYCVVKRILDFWISLVALLVLLIPFAILSAIIYLDDPGEIIFSQYRVGRCGKRFKLYKFRSMKTSTPKYLATSEIDDPNMDFTRVGKVIRKLSLDEIPQLINVLKGDMSLVGPRPLISDEYEIHDMRMRFGVYNIRPGITGLAQVNGRDTVEADQKLRYDVRYLEEFGFWTDLKILLITVPKVLRWEGFAEGKRGHRNKKK